MSGDQNAEMTRRVLTTLAAHLAAECPDRDNCWAADIHDKYDPHVVPARLGAGNEQ